VTLSLRHVRAGTCAAPPSVTDDGLREETLAPALKDDAPHWTIDEDFAEKFHSESEEPAATGVRRARR